MIAYRLIGRLPVPCPDPNEWAKWHSTADLCVRLTEVGPLRISTVFLAIDHNYYDGGDPILFETMIFDDGDDTYQTRCHTWDEAERMHDAAVAVAVAQVAQANRLLGDSLANAVRRIGEFLDARNED